MFRSVSSLSLNLSIKCLHYNSNGIRTFLSESYLCNEAWQRRMDNPILKNIKMNTYFIEVDKKFQTKRLASGVDIDIFANCVNKEHQLEELEHLLYRFRRTKRAVEMLDSTHYAVVRAFLKFKDYESLFRILRDRQNYGVFPDLYSYNILMDTFLKEQRYRDAAEIAVLMMQQEEFSNPISRYLGIYSCQKFLSEDSLDSWAQKGEDEEKADDDDGEEVFVRVPFLRNPWFDDHFDIKDPKHLIGKTFYLIGREERTSLGLSYQLVGLGMYNKWRKAMDLMKKVTESNASLTLLEEGVERFRENLHALPDEDEEKARWTSEFEKNVMDMKKSGMIVSGQLEKELDSAMKKISELEQTDIKEQETLFQKWDENRVKLLKDQEWDIEKEQRLKVIEQKKEELYWKEKLLFFFENEESIMEELEEVEKIIQSQEKKVSAEEAYVPPEIIKKKPTKISLLRKKAMIKSLA